MKNESNFCPRCGHNFADQYQPCKNDKKCPHPGGFLGTEHDDFKIIRNELNTLCDHLFNATSLKPILCIASALQRIESRIQSLEYQNHVKY